ncbi:MAG: hypothetical protein JWQ97_2954 [Phenylobacterium sp.]|nr:hypothetical protein [Phenylobacterium sp.]
MRSSLRAAAAALVLLSAPLGACVTHPGQTPAAIYAQSATQAMLAAETVFSVAAQAEMDAKATGLLAGAKAAEADDLRHQAYQVLLTARAAYKLGRSPDTTALIQLTTQILALSGKQPVAAK